MKSNNFDIVEVLWLRRERKRRAQKIIEGAPPLTYTAKNAGTLKNYRIYGQTVDGESVGDRTANLFDEESTKIPGFIDNNGRINTSTVIPGGVSTYDYIECSASTSYYLRAFTKTDPSSSSITQRVAFFDGNKDFISRILGASSFSFTTPENCSFIRLSLDDNYQNIVLMQDSTEPTEFIPYGYKVPVTIEGKNLLENTATSQTINDVTFIVNEDGSVTCNGTATAVVFFIVNSSMALEKGCILNGCPDINVDGLLIRVTNNATNYYINDIGRGEIIDERATGNVKILIRVPASYTCDSLTFYPMIRKADIEDDTYEPYQEPITTNLYLPEQIKKVGDEAEYIDYAEQKQHFVGGTSVDVALPALPTLPGTNTLSVGTEVQPSKVMVRGKLKE